MKKPQAVVIGGQIRRLADGVLLAEDATRSYYLFGDVDVIAEIIAPGEVQVLSVAEGLSRIERNGLVLYAVP